MKFTTHADQLRQMVAAASRATAARLTLPVLANVYVGVDSDGLLTVKATNLEIAIVQTAQIVQFEPGETTVPARILNDWLATVAGGMVEAELKTKTQILHLSAGSTKTRIKCIDAQEYPPITVAENGVIFPVLALRRAVSRTVYAASTDEARPILTGVLIERAGNVFTLAASDGFRLATSRFETDHEVDVRLERLPKSAVVPARALTEFLKLATGDSVAVSFESNLAQFVGDDWALITQLIDGHFPDFRQIVPKKTETTVTVNRSLLLQAVRQADIFSREASHVVRLKVRRVDEDTTFLNVFGQSVETGDNESALTAETTGPELTIGLNTKFLMDVIASLEEQSITLEMTTDTSPVKVVENGTTAVIMPVHIAE